LRGDKLCRRDAGIVGNVEGFGQEAVEAKGSIATMTAIEEDCVGVCSADVDDDLTIE
jgi:hypothetical protein